jgi:hypothetical protein
LSGGAGWWFNSFSQLADGDIGLGIGEDQAATFPGRWRAWVADAVAMTSAGPVSPAKWIRFYSSVSRPRAAQPTRQGQIHLRQQVHDLGEGLNLAMFAPIRLEVWEKLAV